jgi:hypothetical protein
MDQRSSGKGRLAVAILGTMVAVILWSFGIEFVLHTYIFILPPEHSIQKSE